MREERAQREKRQRQRQAAEELAALRARLERLPPGPNLPPYKRHATALDVLEFDLDDAIPDGWGSWWPEECERLGKRIGIPPAAVPLLMICEWVFGLRPPARKSARMTGGSLCASPAWLARKVGCGVRWLKRLTNRLDPWAEHRRQKAWTAVRNSIAKSHGKQPKPMPKPPTGGGTAFVQRHPRIRLYQALQREVPAAQRLPKWMDKAGKLHDWLDLPARWYPTVMGVRALRRRAHRRQPRKGQLQLRRSPMQEDLYRRLAPLYRRLRARLAPRVRTEATPNNVPLAYSYSSTGAPRAGAAPSKARSGADPPARGAERPAPEGSGRGFRGPS